VIRVHLIARDNGAGLSRDLEILQRVIGEAGFELTVSAIGAGGVRRFIRLTRVRMMLASRARREGASLRKFDVNLMDEHLRREYAPLARRNVLMPHPEWFDVAWTPELRVIDRVFAKTRHAVPLFEALGCRTDFTGFTSFDRLLRDVAREPTFFHLGGRSGNKGSQAIMDLWARKPSWPLLTLIQRKPLRLPATMPANVRLISDYIEDAELQALQNRNLFHLCPSETEGFGHHLVEGMSVGAILLVTDAPPMNEMVTPERGVLAAYARTGKQQLATTYYVDPAALEAGVERMLAFDAGERRVLSERARAWWETNDRAFGVRLSQAITTLAAP
jgi:glycosyl transferase family 1